MVMMMIKCWDDDYDRDDGDSDDNDIDDVEEEEDENAHGCRFIQDRKVIISHLPTPKNTVVLKSGRSTFSTMDRSIYTFTPSHSHICTHTQIKNLYTL